MGADAFWAAFKLVNFFRLFLGEGAMGNAMLPVLKEVEAKEPGSSRELAASCARLAVLACFLFLALGSIFLEPVVDLYQPGMGAAARTLTLTLTRIMAPYLVLIGLVSVLMTPLQAERRFFPVAAHPLLFNLAMISFALAHLGFASPAHALAWGVVAGGVLQAGLLLQAAHKLGVPILKPGGLGLGNPAIREIGQLMLPTLLGVALMRVTTLVDGAFASMIGTGALSHLQYGSLLFNAALGVAGVGVSTVFFTALSESRAAGNAKGFSNALGQAGGLIFLLTVPIGVLAVVFPETLARIYFWGHFQIQDLGPTAAAIRGYFAGLTLGALFHLLSRALYARKQQHLVVRSGILAATANIILDWLLVGRYGVGGLAAATSLALLLNILCLAFFLRTPLRQASWPSRLGRTLLPALLVAGVVQFLPNSLLHSAFLLPPFYAGLYLVILHVWNTAEYRQMIGMIQRRRV
jgi:putative peptidoglycan lipid II flippase